MNRKALRSCLFAVAAIGVGPAPAAAQGPAPGWRPFVSVTLTVHHEPDLRDGGSFRARGAILRAGVAGPVSRDARAGLALAYDRIDFEFADPAGFGGRAPWGDIERTGVSVPLVIALTGGWGLGVTPSVDAFRETGADTGKSLTKGAVVSAVKRYADGDRLGLGVGIFSGLAKTRVFPFLLVDYALGDRWRLVNPLPAGPTGPAGLELDYRFDSEWRLGVGATWRTTRFRLRPDGQTPSGIGEERGVPLFLRATRSYNPGLSLNLYLGTVLNGRLRVEDEDGHELRDVRFDAAPFVGTTLSARF